MKKTNLIICKLICFMLFIGVGFTTFAQAPGGVTTGLGFWIKADTGTNTTTDNGVITAWNDQSANSISTATISGTPLFQSDATNLFNFNPSIQVSNGYLQYPYSLPQDNYNQPAGNYFIGSIARNDGTSEGTLIATEADQAYAFWLGNNGGFRRIWVASFSSGTTNSLSSSSISGHAMFANERENITPGVQSPDLLYLNGELVGSFISGANISSTNTVIRIGGGTYRAGRDLDGTISETYIYNRALTDLEQQRIDSYLALKYGITLNQTTATNYLNSTGITIWDGTVNSSYNFDVFGIGEDTDSALNQKVSRSVNNTNSPILATTQHFTQENNHVLRTASLGNGNFMVLGHNNGVENAFTSSFDGGSNNRSDRVWKIDETGTVGNVYFAIPKSNYTFPTGTPSIVISNDITFDASDTVISFSDDGTFYWAIINPLDGDYLAFTGTNVLDISDEVLNQEVIMFPNPATNILTIESKIQLTKIEIHSILGKKVKEVNSDFNQIDVSGFSKGIYFVRAFSENASTFKKLIKN